MLSVRISFISSLLTAASLHAVPAFADAGHAQNLVSGIYRAKAVVDRAISAAGRSAPAGGGGTVGFPGSGGGFPGSGGGPNPWRPMMLSDSDDNSTSEEADGEVNEADSLALPILMQASTSLATAASSADQAKLAFLSGNIQFANFRFATACSTMGISRSQIARANTAALQPPAGFLAAFGPELLATVTELQSLRISEGCP